MEVEGIGARLRNAGVTSQSGEDQEKVKQLVARIQLVEDAVLEKATEWDRQNAARRAEEGNNGAYAVAESDGDVDAEMVEMLM